MSASSPFVYLLALSLNERIIVRLWKFLYSLGPDGGLKAILSYLTGGSDSLPESLNALLTLFCDCCSQLLPIIDDSEFYELQTPFTLEEMTKMAAFLNSLVFKIIWTRESGGMSNLFRNFYSENRSWDRFSSNNFSLSFIEKCFFEGLSWENFWWFRKPFSRRLKVHF